MNTPKKKPATGPCSAHGMPSLRWWLDPAVGDAPTMLRATEGSAGFDLAAQREVLLLPMHGVPTPINTGVKVAIPEGYAGLLVPRSSLGRRGLILANTVGVIDSDYRGHIIVQAIATAESIKLRPGDRFAQLVLFPILTINSQAAKADALEETERGEGGFGSTGA